MSAVQKYITPAELIKRWGGAPKLGTLANWRSQGKGPPWSKRGTLVVYPLDKLELYEAANDNEPQNENE